MSQPILFSASPLPNHPDRLCRIIDVGDARWVAAVDLFEIACWMRGDVEPRTYRPRPSVVALMAGKSEEEVFRRFSEFDIQEKGTNTNASFINYAVIDVFLKLVGLAEEDAYVLSTGILVVKKVEPKPRQPPTNEELYVYLRDVDKFVVREFRKQRETIESLKNMVLSLSRRVDELEAGDPGDDAADAILAEASRLYAKGKAMKAGRS